MKHFGNMKVSKAIAATRALVGVAVIASGLFATITPMQASASPFLQPVVNAPPPTGARSLCRQYSWACAASGAKSLTREQELRIVKAVNRRVNRSTRAVSDQAQYRLKEKWSLPTRRGGDCEDFALLKKRDLVKMGLDPSKLLLATVLDTRRNSHAVLVYRSSYGDLVLDNLTDRIKPWKATRYLFLRMQDPSRPENWVGVFRRG
ncbi:hypothetical protein AVO45_04020 [Ruegeria marisrubri]|uniref:Transglutaminase n=1 Tax=Ruegeria marisrubri TaxID=1685379 RepID=A0A101CZL1_9RHOB|nr:transglutaminase-like cysteine peptidase [Ruegeria marisrubri]KUJ86140.1 hypothetical protein AVO45_04020 [Ruegeria marisrubri]